MYHRNVKPARTSFVVALLAVPLLAGLVCAQQTTSFTYQGRLTDGGAPANGPYDLQFTLWDSAAGGTQQPQPAPATLTKTNVAVTGGVFSVLLDFGISAFPGADRFLEIGVKPAGRPDAFALLSSRQQISSTPYAIRTLSATAADSLSNACDRCVNDSQINSVAASKLTGTIPVSSLPSDSTSYIRNTTTLQTNSNFNVSGNGSIGGAIGIGTAAPQSKLHLVGRAGVLSPFGGLLIDQTLSQIAAPGSYPLQIRTTASIGLQSITRTDLMVNDVGNVGIGTATPSSRLDVRGHLILDPSVSPILYTSSSSGEQNRFLQLINSPSTPSASGLKAGGLLVADSFSFADPGKNDLIVKGNVGIGTTVPGAKLQAFATGNGVAVEGLTDTGIAVDGRASGIGGRGIVGVGNIAGSIGVSGISTNGTGVKGSSTNGYAMYALGNAGQVREGGGWVKAMALVSQSVFVNPAIVRCYNSLLPDGGASQPNCGFTIQNGRLIDFGFQVNDRFISVTPASPSGDGKSFVTGVRVTTRPECLICTTRQVDVSLGDKGPYYIFIF